MVCFFMFTVEPLSTICMLVRVCFLAGTILVDMRKIAMYHELCLDLWLCVGVFGPMSLHWLSWDALLG